MRVLIVLFVTLIGLLGCGQKKLVEHPTMLVDDSLKSASKLEVVAKNDTSNLKLDTNLIQYRIEQTDINNSRQFPTKLKFSTGKIIDIRNIDPYKNLSYQNVWQSEDELERLYDLSNLSRAEQDEILKGVRINPDAFRENNYLRLLTKTPVIEIQKNRVAIAYHAAFYSNEEDVLATQGYVLIFDEKGNKVFDFFDTKDGFYDIRLSKNGKLLMQKYGVDYGEDGGGQLDKGFRFYDLDKRTKIYEWFLGKDQHLRGFDFFFDTEYFKFYRIKDSIHEHYLLDVTKQVVYFKPMDRIRYSNDPQYRNGVFPAFSKTLRSEDLLKDGFKIINK